MRSSNLPDSSWWNPLVWNDAEVRRRLPLALWVDLQAMAFRTHSLRRGGATPRTGLTIAGGALKVASMTAIADDGATVVTKVLASAHANRDRGWPRSSSTLIALDAASGRPRAVIAGTYLTNARTAAAAVLALETLAGDGAAGDSLGIYGSGPIAGLVLEILASRPRRWRVRVYSPTEAHRRQLASTGREYFGLEVEAVADPHAAAYCAAVLLATDGKRSVEGVAALCQAPLILSIASRRDVAEVPLEALVGARCFVDDRQAAVAEAGEFAGWDPSSLVELGDVLSGGGEPSPDKRGRRVFKATGLAIQDATIVRALLETEEVPSPVQP